MIRYPDKELFRPGAMGTIYTAWDPTLERQVALKEVRGADAGLLHALKGEFRKLARLVHPNLVTLFELVEEDGKAIVVMEFVPGRHFDAWVREGTPSHQVLGAEGIERLRAALWQLWDALSCMHAHGLIHRDLKPNNILIEDGGRVVVLDFGLTARPSTWTASSARGAGTAAFMPPEAFRGTFDEATDVFAVGVIIAQCLIGSLPWPASDDDYEEARTKPLDIGPRVGTQVPEAWVKLVASLTHPDPQLRGGLKDLQAALGIETTGESVHGLAEVPFVGRKDQLDALQAAFERVKAGQTQVVRVRGPSAMGKTALVEEFLRRAATSGVVVGRGACHEDDHLAYKAMDGIVESWDAALGSLPVDLQTALRPRFFDDFIRIFPWFTSMRSQDSKAPRARRDPIHDGEVERAPGSAEHNLRGSRAREHAVTALRELVAILARRWTVVISVDDLHWVDADSLFLLQSLVEVDGTAIMLVVTEPEHSQVPLVREENSRSIEQTLSLGPMGEREASALLEAIAPSASPADLQAQIGAADRSPLLLVEVGRAAARGATHGRTDLGALLRARAEALSEGDRSLLEVLCIAGAPLPTSVALKVAQTGDQAGILRLVRQRLAIRTRGLGEVGPLHASVASAVREGVDLAQRSAVHREVAEAWEAVGSGDADVLSRHYELGGDDQNASRLAWTALEDADQKLAFHSVAETCKRILRRGWASDPTQLTFKLAEALTSTGQLNEAARFLQPLATSPTAPQAQRDDAALRAAEAWMLSGNTDAGLEILGQRLSSLGAPTDRPTWRLGLSIASHLFWLVTLGVRKIENLKPQAVPAANPALAALGSAARGMAFVRAPLGLDYALRALRLAVRTGDGIEVARTASFVSASVLMQIGPLRGVARRCIDASRRLAGADPRDPVAAVSDIWSGMASLGAGDWIDARHRLVHALDALEGAPRYFAWECNCAAGLIAWLDQLAGDFVGERTITERFLREAELRGDRYGVSLFSQYASWVELASDRPDLARLRALQAAEAAPAKGLSVTTYYAAFLQAHCDLYDGKVDDAERHFADAQRSFVAIQGHMTPQGRIDNNLMEARILIARPLNRGSRARLEQVRRSMSQEVRPDADACFSWLTGVLGHSGAAPGQVIASMRHRGLPSAALALHLQSDGGEAAESALVRRGVVDPGRWSRAFWPLHAIT
jgi:serine/threonine protein kinase